jgi:hypothetical protein
VSSWYGVGHALQEVVCGFAKRVGASPQARQGVSHLDPVVRNIHHKKWIDEDGPAKPGYLAVNVRQGGEERRGGKYIPSPK